MRTAGTLRRLLEILAKQFDEKTMNTDPDFIGENTDERRVALFASAHRKIESQKAQAKEPIQT